MERVAMKYYGIGMVLLGLTVSAVQADTWTVDDDGPADFNTIRSAMEFVSDGDEIVVFPGTYTGTGGNAAVVDMFGKAVWLHSSDGQESTFIDGENNYTGIYCYSGETNKTIIEGFTIQNCSGLDGGGMYLVNNAHPTITNCTFTNNTADYGGGMFNYSSSPTLINCTFIGNAAIAADHSKGGGMYNYSSSPTLENCTFTSNTVTTGGGGMSNSSSSPTLTDCIFENNTANDYGGGGGMYNYLSSNPTLTGCTFTNNTATGIGGGMHNISSSSPAVPRPPCWLSWLPASGCCLSCHGMSALSYKGS